MVSAALLIGVLQHEGYTDHAVIPVPGDVPTIGAGRTEGVKMGDKTNPVREMTYLLNNLETRYAAGVRKCIAVPLYQHEFDAYVDLSYNVGVGAFCHSDIAKRLNRGDYQGACEAIVGFRATVNGIPVKGLANRRREEFEKCTGAG